MTVRHFVDVHVLLVRDGSLLLSRRRSADRFDGRWHLPAGKLEAGEPARAGRWAGSAKTECGIHIAPLAGAKDQ